MGGKGGRSTTTEHDTNMIEVARDEPDTTFNPLDGIDAALRGSGYARLMQFTSVSWPHADDGARSCRYSARRAGSSRARADAPAARADQPGRAAGRNACAKTAAATAAADDEARPPTGSRRSGSCRSRGL